MINKKTKKRGGHLMVMTVALTGTGNMAVDAPQTTGTGASVAGAVTVNADAGVITTESLTAAAGTNFTLNVTNSKVAPGDRILCTLNTYAGAGIPILLRAQCTVAGTMVILIRNIDAAAALDDVLVLSFQIGKAIA